MHEQSSLAIHRREDRFQGGRGESFYCQWWQPANAPRAVVVVVHGLGEHSGRYESLAPFFCQKGMLLAAFDLPGHGRSPGQRGYLRRWSDATTALHAFVECMSRQAPAAPVFLLGHSLGGVMALDVALEDPQDFKGLILSAPALQPQAISALEWWLAKTLDVVFPRFSLSVLSNVKSSTTLSRDERDPLSHSKATARLGMEVRRALARLEKQVAGLTVSTLLVHSRLDRVASIAGSRGLAAHARPGLATLLELEGEDHEPFGDESRGGSLPGTFDWMEKQLLQRQA